MSIFTPPMMVVHLTEKRIEMPLKSTTFNKILVNINRLSKRLQPIMEANNVTETKYFKKPGERLNHILDKINFKKGRGRVSEFQEYLTNQSPEWFSEIKYTTVRSWFSEHAPPMNKINAAIEALNKNNEIPYDLSYIKTWWKVGGHYPFEVNDNNQEASDFFEKLQYKIMALISLEVNSIEDISVEKLNQVREQTLDFARSFKDPKIKECPESYLKILIQHFLNSNS